MISQLPFVTLVAEADPDRPLLLEYAPPTPGLLLPQPDLKVRRRSVDLVRQFAEPTFE